MAFDIQGAREAGYSDDEIADHLSKKAGFDIEAARRAGYEAREILAELSKAWAKQDLPAGVKESDAGAGRGSVAPTDAAIPKPTPAKSPTLADLRQGPGAVLENVRQAARPGDRIGKGGVPEQKPVIGRDPLSTPNPDFTPGPADLQAAQVSDERALREVKQRAYTAKVGAPDAQAPSADTLLGESVAGVSANPLYRGMAGGVSNLAQTGIGAVRAGADALGLDGVAEFAQGASKKAGAVEQAATADLKANDKLAADIFASITASAPSMAVGMIGGPGLKTLFAQSALAEYNTGRNAGFSEAESATRAGIFGMAEALGERFGFPQQIQLLKSIGKHVPTSELGKVAAEMLAKEIPGEQLTTAMQFMADKFGPAAQNPNATLSDYLDQAGETLKVTIGQSALMGGGPVAISKAKDTYRAADKAIGGDTGITQDAESLAKSKGFLTGARPVDMRAEAFKRLDDVGAKHGIASNIVAAIKKAADGKPVEDLTGWMRRALSRLAQTGDIAPVSEETLALLDRQTEQADSAPLDRQTEQKTTPALDRGAEQDFSGLADAATPTDEAAHAAATSPRNSLPEPTEAQKAAGNYTKGHIRVAGMDLTIENPAGSVRRGTAPDGRQWETPMVAHYGYVKGTRAGDGDHSDIFVKPGTTEDWAGTAFVIDQIDPKTGKFDEHKTVLGADSEEEARALYLANYEKGWGGLGAITALPIDAYKSWVKDGIKSKPLGTLPQGTGTAAPAQQPAATSTGANDGQGQEGQRQEVLTAAPAVGVTYKAPDGRTLRIYVSTPNRVGVADEKGNKSSIARGSPGWVKMEQAIAASQPKTETAPQPAPAAAPASQPARKPKVRNHPDTVRGSNALAEISRALGGISPDIISDLSQKTTRTRTSSKTGKKTIFTTWDNPAIPGVGPLFRRGGTSDLTEIARVLEDAGYIEAGLLERDYLEARNRAQDIVKAELADGGSSLRIGDPDAIEAEMRRRAEMDVPPETPDSFDDAPASTWADDWLSPDDQEATGYTSIDPDVQAAVDALLDEAEALGIDRESLIEDAARQTADLTEKDYRERLQQLAQEAIDQARGKAVQADPAAARAGDQGGRSDAQATQRPGSDWADGSDQAVRSEGEAEGLTSAERRKLEVEYQTRATEILQEIGRRGDLKKLFRSFAGVRTVDGFTDLSIDEQASAYADYIESGAQPVTFNESYNEKVARMERDALVRRLQSDDEVRQSNGKPFKTEASAATFQADHDLGITHAPKQVDGGFVLRRRSPADQEELRRAATGRLSYAEAQKAVVAQMGIGETVDGELDATEEQFAEMERRIGVLMRGDPQTLTLTSETEAEAQAKAQREAQALADERKKRDQEQARLDKEAADREAKARADATVDDFQLGQSADQQLSGQTDIFSQPEEPASEPEGVVEIPADLGSGAPTPAPDQATKRNSAAWRDEGKTKEQLQAERIDQLALDLAATITEEASQQDFAPSELPQVMRNWAEDHRVPADALRLATLKVLDKFDLSAGRKGQIRKALADAIAEPRAMTEEGRAADGQPINPGDTFRTTSGRVTTPYPKQKGARYASDWLIDNALAEAKSRGDDFNVTSFRNERPLKSGELAPASRDSMLMYLFGQQPKVVPSILKPLTGPTRAEMIDSATKQFTALFRDMAMGGQWNVYASAQAVNGVAIHQEGMQPAGVTDVLVEGVQGMQARTMVNALNAELDRRNEAPAAKTKKSTPSGSQQSAPAQIGNPGTDSDTTPPTGGGGKPRKQVTIKAEPGDSEEVRQAKADALKALADLGDLLGGPKAMMLPEQEQKLLPVLTRLFDAAFRLGYLKFKDAAKWSLDQIRSMLGDGMADQITLDHLQGAYITMAGSRDGASSKKEVIGVEDIAEVHSHEAQNTAQEPDDAPSNASDLERDRVDTTPEDSPVAPDVRVPPDATVWADGRPESVDRQPLQGQQDWVGLPPGGAATGRASGDQPVSGGQRADGPSLFSSRDSDSQRSDDPGIDGVPPDTLTDEDVEDAAAGGLDLAAKRSAQLAAERVEIKVGDLDNIRQTLPYLLEGQQEDVWKAETRFSAPSGYGMLFTNGTGTGKTYTGLGIVKRFARQGKGNILVLVPDDKIASDWIESAPPLGLKVTQLANTKDPGNGIVVTTYANAGDNDTLATREWDLVVADESHSLMQNADATDTKALDVLRAITLHPTGAGQRFTMLNRPDIDRASVLREQIIANNKVINRDDTMAEMVTALRSENAKLEAELTPLERKLKAAREAVGLYVESRQGARRPRVTFLSATPFAYEKNIDYAEGYLFDYDDGSVKTRGGYNQPNPRQVFFIQHFGYRMRYGKLTEPDAKVNRGLMQRQFNGWLRKQGVLSTRMLDVAADYDRRFVLVNSAIGHKIDAALKWIEDKSRAQREADKEAPNGYAFLGDQLRETFYGKLGHLMRRYLLEAIKAKEVIAHVREHMAMGRKVVVFHDFKKGGSVNPFNFPRSHLNEASESWKAADDAERAKMRATHEAYNAAVDQFGAAFPELAGDALLADLISPISRFTKEFPNVLLINGDEKKKDLLARYKVFNDDSVGPIVALVQSDKNKGWSGHDTTGKHQRVLFNLGLPTAPSKSIQTEGRIYRTGQVTDAIQRYLNTGTNWERWAFASTIAERASTVENLAMGEQARALKESFIKGFEESDDFRAGHEGEGKGGKEFDRQLANVTSEWDRALAYYFGQQKKTSRTKAQEGNDYFATPEPVGLKMVEWANVRGGEDALEPSGGHGAIARWLPENTNRTAIEPSAELASRMALVFDGKIIQSDFESLHVSNKFDGIVMNPPFGTAGKTAVDHVAKAATHLRPGGRIVALIPEGPAADKKFDKWFYESEERPVKPVAIVDLGMGEEGVYVGDTIKSHHSWQNGRVLGRSSTGALRVKTESPGETLVPESNIRAIARTGPRTETIRPAEGIYMIAQVHMPGVTFERAGTQVRTRIVVLEKMEDGEQPTQAARNIDLSGIKEIGELFDRLRDLSLPDRLKQPDPEIPEIAKVGPVERSELEMMGEASRGDAKARMDEAIAQFDTGAFATAAVKVEGALRASKHQAFKTQAEKLVNRLRRQPQAQAKADRQKQVQAAQASGVEIVEHITQKGKKLQGVVRTDLSRDQAKSIDAYTFSKDGGWFIRAEHIPELNKQFPAPGTVAEEERAVYAVNEPGDTKDIPLDLFPDTLEGLQAVPAQPRVGRSGARGRAAAAGDVHATPVLSLRQDAEFPGTYHVTTQLVSVGTKQLPVSRVTNWQEAASALGAMQRYAVEHFDALLTDKDGRPLAVVGSFKGAQTQTSIYPSTVLGEALRIEGATDIWGVHNHPSGNTTLSPADRMLNANLAATFEPTGIRWRGLAAVGDGRFTAEVPGIASDIEGIQITSRKPVSVPVVERTIERTKALGELIESPSSARRIVLQISGGKPGILFLSSQHEVTAWVPGGNEEFGKLRGNGGFNRLINSANKALAGAAIIANPGGVFSYRVLESLATALQRGDIRLLDVVDKDQQFSAADRGDLPSRQGTILSRPSPTYFSALQRAAEASPMKAGDAGAWRQWLKGITSSGKAKAEEIAWSGLEEWLQLQPGKITKAQVVDFLAANGVRVEETVLGANNFPPLPDGWVVEETDDSNGFGDPGWVVRDEDGEVIGEGGTREEAIRSTTDPDERAGVVDTKYGQYTLPGGTNYREVLLTLPSVPRSDAAPRPLKALPDGYDVIFDGQEPAGRQWGVTEPGQMHARPWAGRHADPDAARAAALEKLNAERLAKWKDAAPEYRSGHWDQPNILAHIRLNDRTAPLHDMNEIGERIVQAVGAKSQQTIGSGAPGLAVRKGAVTQDEADWYSHHRGFLTETAKPAPVARILFVEEIQSDWAQEGKKKGFDVPADTTGFTAERVELYGEPYWKVKKASGEHFYSLPAAGVDTEVEAIRAAAIKAAKHEGGPPVAPFVTKTDAWVALALKRVIKLAVDGGYDKVAFVTGEQSAERYDLSKQISKVEYLPTAEGVGSSKPGVLRAWDVNGKNVLDKNVPAEDLPDHIGKEVAQRLLDSGPAYITGSGKPVHRLEGLDLKIGGEGMRAFYDKIVPSVAKDVLRKVGGGQMTDMTFGSSRLTVQPWPGGEGFIIYDEQTKEFYRGGDSGRPWVDYPKNAKVYLSESSAKKALPQIEGGAVGNIQPGFDITPAMREAAAGGLPLFKRAQAANDAGLSASDLQPVADALTSNGVKATVLPSRDQLPPAALAEVKTVDPTGIARGALTSDGQIWLFANRLGSHAEAFEVALHEGFHRGLRLLGDKGSKVLAQIYATNAKVRKLADAYQKDYPDLDREDATNEALADLAGRGEVEKLNYWAALKRLVRDFLRRVADAAGITMEWTDADVTRFVASMSRKGLTNGAHADGGAQLAVGAAELSRPPRHTPEEQAALAKAGITPGRTLRQSVVQAWNKATMLLRNRAYLKLVAQQATLDQFVGIKDVVQRELGGLPVDQDPYITARLANGGSASVMHALLLHGQAKWAPNKQHLVKIDGTRGLLDILAPLGDDLNDWFGWMVGNRAERLKREGREKNLTDADIRALQGLANTPEKLAKFRAAAVEYAAFKRSVLDIAQGAGLIDPAGRQVWDHADYIPFYRQIDERSTFSPTGRRGLSGQSSGIRVLKGGEAALNDPMENLLMNFSRLIDASLKNNALRKTLQAVDGTWLVTKVGYEMAGQIMPKSQVKKILEDAGTPPDIIDVLPDEAFDGMAKIWAIQAPADPDVVRVMVGGKPQFYRVDEPVLLRSLTSFVPFDMPGLAAARMFKRLLTSAVTSTPDFLARNFIRDSLATRMISRDAVTVGSAIRGLGRSFAEKGAGEAMLFAGASFQGGQVSAGNIEGSARTMRRALRRKGIHAGASGAAAVVIDSPARLWDLWTKARDATENANREAVYEAALKAGRGDTLAAFEAKDLMDFSLRGGHPLYQVAADVLPFFNARMQGLYRLARSDPRLMTLKTFQTKLMRYGVFLAILSAALAAINAGRDDYNRLPDWEKDTYWHLFVGGQHFKVPKPFELGAVFGSLPERITRYLMGVDTGHKLGQRIGAILSDQLAVDLVPQMFRPALDVYANWDAFRDRPIETTGDEGKIPSQRFDARTSPTATAAVQAVAPLADRVGLSPKRLEYLIGGYLGTVGTYALGGVDIMVRGFSDGAPTPAWRADDIPVVKSFYAVDPARSTVYESDLYAMREEIEKVYKSINASLAQGDEAGAALLRQRFAKELEARPAIKEGAEDLATIRKDMNAIYADPRLSPKQKRELIDQLQVDRNKVAEETMKDPAVRALR